MDQATGARLRAMREQRGLTTAEVAAAIGIPAEAVADIERGNAVAEYGPGLAAAWTWAVGRHLDVPVDQELATWQPEAHRTPDHGLAAANGPAGTSDAGTAGGSHWAPAPEAPAPIDEPTVPEEPPEPEEPPDVGALSAGEAAPTPESPPAPEPGREPMITPGWLSDFDVDPLDDFDPADSGVPGSLDAPRAERPPSAPTPPDDDLWGPAPQGWPARPDEPGEADEPSEAAEIPEADEPPEAHAPPEQQLDADQPDEQWDDGGDAPPDEVAFDDTGELPGAEDTRVVAYTEGDDVPRLEPRSRVRGALVVIAGLVVLVAAGVGVGAVFAQWLDRPDGDATAGEAAVPDDDAGDPAPDEADDGDDPADGSDGEGGATDPATEDDQADDPSTEPDEGTPTEPDDAAGDPDAAPAPAQTSVQVLDGVGDGERYTEVVATLEELGYQVIQSGGAASEYDETLVLVTDGHDDAAAALAEADERFATTAPNDVGLSEEVELHVVVGRDWPDPGGD